MQISFNTDIKLNQFFIAINCVFKNISRPRLQYEEEKNYVRKCLYLSKFKQWLNSLLPELTFMYENTHKKTTTTKKNFKVKWEI